MIPKWTEIAEREVLRGGEARWVDLADAPISLELAKRLHKQGLLLQALRYYPSGPRVVVKSRQPQDRPPGWQVRA